MTRQHIRHRWDDYADSLEYLHGPCPAGRQALLSWLLDLLARAEQVNAPDTVIVGMVQIRYQRWVSGDLSTSAPRLRR
ncbi:MAG: hypothetical protein ACOH2I_07000 [Pseudomonas sp.]